MNITDAKKLKKECEHQIKAMLFELGDKTGIQVSAINLQVDTVATMLSNEETIINSRVNIVMEL